MCMRAKPVSLSCFMVEHVYIFRHFNELNVHSHSLVVTGSVHSILKRTEMFGNSEQMIKCRVWTGWKVTYPQNLTPDI